MLYKMVLLFLLFMLTFTKACLPDHERRDCLVGEVSPIQDENIDNCRRKGCDWCPSSGYNVPWCYYPVERCGRPLVDCGYEGITEERCRNRGCLYSPNDFGEPWCCHRHNTGGEICPLEIPPESRVDCFPLAEGPSRDGCLARGCLWCPTDGRPWCFFDTNRFPEPVREEERIDCNPSGGEISGIECITRGCQYHPTNRPNVPWCFFPRNRGYRMVGEPYISDKGFYIELEMHSGVTLFKNKLVRLGVDVEYQTNDRVRVKIYDRTRSRFEVPLHIPSPPRRATNPQYDVLFSNDPVFSFRIVRKSTGTVIFDTSIGGLHLEDQFLQIATRLPSDDVYGLGENLHYDFRHDVNQWKSHGMFSRDQPPMEGANLYGVHPVYHVLEKDGNAHGVLFLNSAAQDVTLTPGPALTYRTIGGILDIYVFLGPTPDNVIQQYTEAVGRPVMPPYWALGFSLAKFGYGHIDKLKENIERMRKYEIPQDFQFLDIDYMDEYKDFTYSGQNYPGLPDYIRESQKQGLKFIAILDPAIPNSVPNYRPLQVGNEKRVWVHYNDGRTPVVGKVWPPGEVFFPDYTNPATQDWWVQMCREFHQTLPYDGLWIDMNEPANFYWGTSDGCSFNNVNYPPYKPKIWGPDLFYKTLCPEHTHHIGLHYDVHSLYGWSQAPPTLEGARLSTGRRSLVLSRSTFPGSGRFAVHWLGDNWSRWDSMKASLTGMFEFNMFGIPFIGADICGFIGNAEYELCLRWQQLGAFYPFSRNHNLLYENRDQDPTVWGDDFARITRDTLMIRYTLLPYLYTLFHKAHINGTSVVRPLLNAFPKDPETRIIDRQFLWGSSFMVSPVLDQGSTQVRAYFPDARWFSYYDGREVKTRKGYEIVQAPMDFIPLHVRGGSILPTQRPGNNTHFSRRNRMGLIVALDEEGLAEGSLFWDDGESIDSVKDGNYTYVEYKAIKNELSSAVRSYGSLESHDLLIGSVRIMGVSDVVTNVTLGREETITRFKYNQDTKELLVDKLRLPITKEIMIRWF